MTSKEIVEQVEEWRAEGLTVADSCRAVGVSVTVYRRALDAEAVEQYKPGSDQLTFCRVGAASIVGLNVQALENMRHRGGGPRFTRRINGEIEYSRDDLLDWMEGR